MIINLHNIGIINDNNIEIAPFTIITGTNGSGKSAILTEIEKQNKSVRRFKHTGLSFFKYDFKSDSADILLFEHPENDLYPDLQLKIIDILFDVMKSGKTIIIETHSDHLLNRFTRRYVENEDFRNNSLLYFLKYNSILNVSNIINVPIDLTIGIEIEESYGFFSQYAVETECIINACLENYKLKKGTKNGL